MGWFIMGAFAGALFASVIHRDAALNVSVCPRCGRRWD